MSQPVANDTPLERGHQKVEGMPFFLKGKVIKGFGRGSKQLGIPTGVVLCEYVAIVLVLCWVLLVCARGFAWRVCALVSVVAD